MTAALFPLLALLAGVVGSAWGQQGIYTCVDTKGRRITSDRPIFECLDREQKQLNANGTVRRTVAPSPTPTERAEQEVRERKAADERLRLAEERRMQRALLTRYPSQPVHDGEREKALQVPRDAIATAQRRVADLREQRRKHEAETEFYKSPADWPARLKRQLDENDQQVAAQQRVIATQEEEIRRMVTRFDEELVRLKQLWSHGSRAAAMAVSAPMQR